MILVTGSDLLVLFFILCFGCKLTLTLFFKKKNKGWFCFPILLVLTCYVCPRDLMKTRLGMENRGRVQLDTLGKSSFHPFQMLPQSQNLHQQAILPIPPMAHMRPMVLFTWSILSWLSCKYWVKVQLLCFCPSYYFCFRHIVFCCLQHTCD